jgi:hypothetical protein
MTLIVNEIYYDRENPGKSRIYSAADRRISCNGSSSGQGKKLFHVDRLNLTVSYFGLAEGKVKRARARYSFEELISEFIKQDTSKSIEAFASQLQRHLNDIIPPTLLKKYPSGLHVCGFTPKGIPQMWFITNIGGMDGFFHTNFRPAYSVPSEELSSVHLKSIYDEQSGEPSKSFSISFQNGDLRSFHAAWQLFDIFSQSMDMVGLSRHPSTPAEHAARLVWKMKTIAHYYESVAYQSTIGGKIDVVTLVPDL